MSIKIYVINLKKRPHRLNYFKDFYKFNIPYEVSEAVDGETINIDSLLKTNIIGAQNIIEASIDCKVKKVIALSTDKAAAPINLYGATKLCSDKLFIAANNYSGSIVNFSVVRYGNVFGSRGSFIDSHLNKDNKTILITDKEMTRFSITLNQSANVVDWVINNSIGGEIVIPKIPSYRILDVVKALNHKAKIKIIGLRKGEKIYEEMFSEADSYTTYSIKDFYLIVL